MSVPFQKDLHRKRRRQVVRDLRSQCRPKLPLPQTAATTASSSNRTSDGLRRKADRIEQCCIIVPHIPDARIDGIGAHSFRRVRP